MSEDYSLNTRKTFLETKDEIEKEFRLWRVNEYRIEREKDGAAVVEWYPPDSPSLRVLRSADQLTPASNLRKLYLILKALRLNELRGFAEYMREYYLQLPAATRARDPYEVLGLRPDADIEDAEAMYRSKAKRLHPDAGGTDAAAMTEINQAIAAIRDRVKGAPN